MISENPIIVFDDTCGICNKWVRFILKWDEKKKFKFTSLKSQFAKNIYQNHSLPLDLDSIIYYCDDEVWIKSEAILKILKDLGGVYQFFCIFKIVPLKIRDSWYDIIAKNRYRWFGKSKSCQILAVCDKDRFIK